MLLRTSKVKIQIKKSYFLNVRYFLKQKLKINQIK